MRLFRDLEGREWEAIVGRESWGTVVAIFLLREESGPPRQILLEGSSADEGARLLMEMTQAQLQELLAVSVLKPTG